MNISKDELKKIKIKIFNDYISDKDKEDINKKINEEIEEIIKEFDKESEPIDE